MFRIYHGEGLSAGRIIELSKETSHYVSKVLRLKTGDKIKVFNEAGEYISSVISIEKKMVNLKVLTKVNSEGMEPKTDLVVAFGYLKGDKNELVVQKATELGANYIWPIITERSVVKIDDNRIRKKEERLKKVCKEATEQSGRLKVPSVKIIKDLHCFNQQLKNTDMLLIPWEKECKEQINLDKLKATKGRIILFIGPEGGFSYEEINQLSSFQTITLGKRILRAETAAISATSILMYALGELGG
ncbi:RsmE family RNA methyltransferase [Proteinivorax tanatarense]|uniref:Ribosomal RNA small subunit methyltransferase E n=1 Tax=Proteinivorax tanatarense TaxID=1260629 RepID=A0AAU7VHU2_9FIRM